MENIYSSIAARTGGNIYMGVVGPVRTGKSTLIKKIMELMIIPNIHEPYRKERAKDEIPQCGSGRTIMTSEPKFIPEEAVEISPDGTTVLSVRMIDSVGYMIDGAVGADENGVPRMVTTPWYDHEIPMTEAAEMGTKKVMDEHCTVGLVVTTDGTITDIPRCDYIDAEQKAITDMQQTGKPYLVLINTRNPTGDAARQVQQSIKERFGVEAMIADCQTLEFNDISDLLNRMLYSFPLSTLYVYMPRWIDALENNDPIKKELYSALLTCFEKSSTLAYANEILPKINNLDLIQNYSLRTIDLASGSIHCMLNLPEALYYKILSNKTGITIENDAQLMSLLINLSKIKTEYDAISDALSSVKATGYGVVMPKAEELTLEKPEIVKKGGAYGVKLKAGAQSIHMIRVDIDTEISPMVGGEQQSQDLITYLSSEDPDKLWQSNIFGKSVYTLIQDGLTNKLLQTPEDVREKLRGVLTRVVNEGASGLICLIL